MRYGITVLALGAWPFIEISEEEFNQTKRAKKNLVTFLGIEEKLDILLENYAEYEESLLELALRRSVFKGLDWSSGMADMQCLIRRIANFLSAARLYTDQTKHDLATVYENRSQQELLINSLSREYDNRLGYRVMEALRNYMQHRCLPIRELSYPSGWETIASDKALRYSIDIYLNIVELREDPKFKSTVLSELENRGDKIDVTPLIRQYVEGIAFVHEELRSRTKEDVDNWEQTISDLMDRARGPLDGNLTGLGIVAEDEQRYEEMILISSNPIDRRKNLTRKNSSLGTLSYRYASGYRKREPNDDEKPNKVDGVDD